MCWYRGDMMSEFGCFSFFTAERKMVFLMMTTKFHVVTKLCFPKACPYHHECSDWDWDWGGWRELSLTVSNNLYEWFFQCPDVFGIKTPCSCSFPLLCSSCHPTIQRRYTCICSLCELWEVISFCTSHICFHCRNVAHELFPTCVCLIHWMCRHRSVV